LRSPTSITTDRTTSIAYLYDMVTADFDGGGSRDAEPEA